MEKTKEKEFEGLKMSIIKKQHRAVNAKGPDRAWRENKANNLPPRVTILRGNSVEKYRSNNNNANYTTTDIYMTYYYLLFIHL